MRGMNIHFLELGKVKIHHKVCTGAKEERVEKGLDLERIRMRRKRACQHEWSGTCAHHVLAGQAGNWGRAKAEGHALTRWQTKRQERGDKRGGAAAPWLRSNLPR